MIFNIGIGRIIKIKLDQIDVIFYNIAKCLANHLKLKANKSDGCCWLLLSTQTKRPSAFNKLIPPAIFNRYPNKICLKHTNTILNLNPKQIHQA